MRFTEFREYFLLPFISSLNIMVVEYSYLSKLFKRIKVLYEIISYLFIFTGVR